MASLKVKQSHQKQASQTFTTIVIKVTGHFSIPIHNYDLLIKVYHNEVIQLPWDALRDFSISINLLGR